MKRISKRVGRVLGLILAFAMMMSVGSVYAGDGKIQQRTNGNGYESMLNWTYFFYDTSKNVISSPFGYRWGKYHAGIDVISNGGIDGTAIRSVDSGTVAQTYLNVTGSGSWHEFGYAVSIRLDGKVPFTTNTLHALYMHMKYVPEVTNGIRVSDGALIGYVGETGLDPNNPAHGPHLHFQVTTNGQPYAPYADCINPVLFFPNILAQSRSMDVFQDDPSMYEYDKDDILIPMEIVDYVGLQNVKDWVNEGGLANEDSPSATRKIISEFAVPNAIARSVTF